MADLPRELFQFYPIHVNAIMTLKNHRVWKIFSKEGVYICKALDFPAEETAFVIDAMNHLETMGFYSYNRIVKTDDGASTVSFNGRCFFMAKEILGEPPSFSSPEDAGAVGAFLAMFHRAAKGYHPRSPYPGRIKWGKWPEILMKKCDEMETFETINDRFSLIYRRHLPYFLEDARQSAVFFRGRSYLDQWQKEKKEGGFCHHDMAHHNFLQGENLSLIDFDYALADIRCHDVAQLLLKILKENRWDCRCAFKALEGYDHITPFSAAEPQLISAMLRFPQDFWQVAFARYVENNKEPRLERKLEQWVLRRTRRKQALKTLAAVLS